MRYALILLVRLLALLTACNGAEEAPPTATPSPAASEPATTPEATAPPSPTPTVAAESAGFDGFRAFATRINEAVQAGDASFFAASAVPTMYTCRGGDADYFAPACEGQPAGSTVQAFTLSSVPGEGAFVTSNYFEEVLADWLARGRPDLSDESGDGRLSLYALVHRPASDFVPGERVAVTEAYIAIVTAIVGPSGPPPGGIIVEPLLQGPYTERQIRLLNWQFLDGRWRLTSSAVSSSPELIAAWLSGDCTGCDDRWERWEGTAP